MGYERGDMVVHPRHGTALVMGVLEKDIGSGPTEYLELFVEHASLTVMVPATGMTQVGIRDVASRAQAEKILAVLSSDADVHDRWADRNAATVARLRSGGLDELAMVVRDLSRHAERTGKPLSAAERGARDTCIGVLVRELSLSLKLSADEVTALIQEHVQAR